VTRGITVDTLRGTVVIEFGVNRWVLVTIGSDEGQKQIETRSELAAYLQERGLSNREANDLARKAWNERPRDAAQHVATPDDSLIGATGLSKGTILLIVLAFVAFVVLVVVYLIPRSLS
jgi:hypothetical protein